MANWPLTSATLLLQLRDGDDREVWDQFLKLYRPAVYRFARRMGLQDADADDATQKVLQSVAAAFRNRPPDLQRCRFRSWMAQVTRNAALKLIERQQKHVASGRTEVLELLHNLPDHETEPERSWRMEEQMSLFRNAAADVRAHCTPTVWAAFEQTAVAGRSAEQVAQELNVSVGVVYASRSRILKRIRQRVIDLGFTSESI
ncbi:MAG: sigma-70 family RNA polymerase sigma factor [Planctomycetaceae bacterium]